MYLHDKNHKFCSLLLSQHEGKLPYIQEIMVFIIIAINKD